MEKKRLEDVNEEIQKIIAEIIAHSNNTQQESKLIIARTEMSLAEKLLLTTFSTEQQEYYYNLFCGKRQRYFDAINEMYSANLLPTTDT